VEVAVTGDIGMAEMDKRLQGMQILMARVRIDGPQVSTLDGCVMNHVGSSSYVYVNRYYPSFCSSLSNDWTHVWWYH
jgi:hypothetical protein